MHVGVQDAIAQRLSGGIEGFYEQFVEPLRAQDTDGCLNSGDYWSYYSDMMKLRESLGDRAIVMTFESLKTDFRTEVDRLATFLEVDLSEDKFTALARHVSMEAMLDRGSVTVRIGRAWSVTTKMR